MATTTTNFGWDIPQSTDLVKDGATAIAALGQDIDTALIDLKGGTTGQVLSKASGTDLDYTWVTSSASKVLQIVTSSLTTTASTTSTSFVDTGLSVTITPTSASNKVLLFVSMAHASTGTNDASFITLTDNSNNILIDASSPGSRTPAMVRKEGATVEQYTMNASSLVFSHTPGVTSAFTYKLRHRVTAGGSATSWINRIPIDDNTSSYPRGVCTIIAMEVL
jgi:hypothetical protein